MISMDMKYTALYWALRYEETALDVHTKNYNGYKITIYAEKQYVDFGKKIKCNGKYPLTSHKSFVVLECIDRLLNEGYTPEQIVLDETYDIIIDGNIAINCIAWGDYGRIDFKERGYVETEIVYTSRLVSGLLEYKGSYSQAGYVEEFGFGVKGKTNILADSNFEIVGDELVRYKGKEAIVQVPEGIVSIGASAFWNNTYIKEVLLPNTLERIGGDCFYYCTNLEKVTIPSRVNIMGNNPFAGCPKLDLSNESSDFCIENGVLFDKVKSIVIYYPICKPDTKYTIPNTVKCIGKHCFFMCDNLEKITIQEGVIKLENNPFSGCTKLSVENHSSNYHFDNGVIYNKYKTAIVGCLNGSIIEKLTIPESVTSINRNAFWNCKGIKKIVISKNITRIGYNPFAGCENLILESESDDIVALDGVLYDKTATNMLCATNASVGAEFVVPDSVSIINRGVFSGCIDLKTIDLNKVTCIDKSSFTNCTSLTEIYIPDSVTYIGEWAFAYCSSLKKVSVSRNTKIDKNAFNECPVQIEWRNQCEI